MNNPNSNPNQPTPQPTISTIQSIHQTAHAKFKSSRFKHSALLVHLEAERKQLFRTCASEEEVVVNTALIALVEGRNPLECCNCGRDVRVEEEEEGEENGNEKGNEKGKKEEEKKGRVKRPLAGRRMISFPREQAGICEDDGGKLVEVNGDSTLQNLSKSNNNNNRSPSSSSKPRPLPTRTKNSSSSSVSRKTQRVQPNYSIRPGDETWKRNLRWLALDNIQNTLFVAQRDISVQEWEGVLGRELEGERRRGGEREREVQVYEAMLGELRGLREEGLWRRVEEAQGTVKGEVDDGV